MEAWMAFVSIIAIVAIVVVAGGLIAFIAHMIMGAFGNGTKTPKQNKELIDYAQFKQLEYAESKTDSKEYDFEAINESKAKKEKELLEKETATIFDIDKDDELEEIENRLKAASKVEDVVTEESKLDLEEDDELDEIDFDNMLNEISNDVIEDEKAQNDSVVKMSEELESYSIDELLKQANEEVVSEETEEVTSEEIINSEVEEDEEPKSVDETLVEEAVFEAVKESEEEVEKTEEEVEKAEEVQEEVVSEETIEEPLEEIVEESADDVVDNSKNEEIESLKAQLAELNKQLEEARSVKTNVVRINTTEEECLARLETLEERLKNVKKEYKVNAKEYRPLKKVMNDLERYQTKLRRKETVVAKKKVALYGVNNYVDIDKEKAEKLANELDLLDGLRLSVNHCEDVINANKDRFPILEHTNQILEDQIAHLEADIASTQATLAKIRENKDNGEGSQE